MQVNTKNFGLIDIDDDKLITFPQGIVGFPELNKFALIHDEEEGSDSSIKWLQSMDEPAFAMPVMNPLLVKEDYNPNIEDELFEEIGGLDDEAMLVLITLTVPKEVEKMSVNLKAPFVINAETKKGMQVILDGDEYPVKYPIFELLKNRKAGE